MLNVEASKPSRGERNITVWLTVLIWESERRSKGRAKVLANCPATLVRAWSLSWWQVAGRILELCGAGTQLAAITTLEARLLGGQQCSGKKWLDHTMPDWVCVRGGGILGHGLRWWRRWCQNDRVGLDYGTSQIYWMAVCDHFWLRHEKVGLTRDLWRLIWRDWVSDVGWWGLSAAAAELFFGGFNWLCPLKRHWRAVLTETGLSVKTGWD